LELLCKMHEQLDHQGQQFGNEFKDLREHLGEIGEEFKDLREQLGEIREEFKDLRQQLGENFAMIMSKFPKE
jgi:predicted  nucleic acid-binding Zn-ribbon protein